MSLVCIEISRIEPGCIAVSGNCDLGTPTPVLPGLYTLALLQRLASPHQVIVAEVPAPAREQNYYLDCHFPTCPLQQGVWHRLSGRGLVLGALRTETAPFWLEKAELLRGYLVGQEAIERLAVLLSSRHRLNDVFKIAPLRFELYSTKTLLLQSFSLPESDLVDAAAHAAMEWEMRVWKDEETLQTPVKHPRPKLLSRLLQ